jgi:hypothetical protein
MDTTAAIDESISAINTSNRPSSKPTRFQRVSQEVFAYCQKHRLCLKCKEPGHQARYCTKPVKNLNLPAQ